MEIKKVYIAVTGSTVREKNMKLSAIIATAPNVNRRIIKIEKDQDGNPGYWFFYLDTVDTV